MPSTSETGHAKDVANFEKLHVTCVTFGPAYNPSNAKLVLAALGAKHTAADNAVKAVVPFQRPFKDATDTRGVTFDTLNPMVRSALNHLESCDGVSQTTL